MVVQKPFISYSSEKRSEKTVRGSLAQPVKDFVETKFGSLNNVQQSSIPSIVRKESILVMSPTGSGKTLASFLGILSELIQLEKENNLKKHIYVLYISPFKALNKDIHKNLEVPLEYIRRKSSTIITAAKRTGDTTPKERAKLLTTPPHILITTPESLALMLTAPKFKDNLRNVQWLIVDEIHSLAGNKRGSLLSICVERLEYYLKIPLTRIGLSATVEPVETIANYLIGNRSSEIKIVDMGKLRELEIEVISPVQNLVHAPYHLIRKRHIELINDFVLENRTCLIFTNTRNLSEKLVYDLTKIADEKLKDKIAVHHGSLDKQVRLEVEDNLKHGRMKAVFSSTSLELGIDIGSIDLTIQIGSPKTIRALLQRIGRSGHSQELVSKGKILVFNRDDLIECIAAAKLALEGRIDEIRIPSSPADVLIQMLTGMALEKKWSIDEAFNVIKKAYSYKDLSKKEFHSIIQSASNPTSDDDGWKYGHIWYDIDTKNFGKRKSSRQAYMQNIGTIPDSTAVEVILEGFRTRIGQVAERFSEKLTENGIFVLGGKSYQFVRSVGNKIIVREVSGKVPTIPSWTGEALSRSWNISREVSSLLTNVDLHLQKNGKQQAILWLESTYPIGRVEATSVVNYIVEQRSIAPVPTLKKIVVES
ncbi:MAG: DEAD/DEAH box helicase, partial [Candidatus Kariarchaeaceae archaeon]